jgi:D-alanyl-D-alanine carboxypeptidase/D-alanyl-D-alanine-endopeptidase (penicillin-binding protein 4)
MRKTFVPLILLALATVARPGEGQPQPSARVETASKAAPIDAAPIRAAIAELKADVDGWGGSAAVMVLDLVTGAPIAALDEHAAMNPASNAKLTTAAVALKRLGGSRRFLTGLYGAPQGDRIEELVLRGEGDPSLATADLWALAHELRGSGIQRVESIAVDQSAFDGQFVPPAFEQQPDEWAGFRAPVAAVSLNGNTVTFVTRAGKAGSEARVVVDPPGFVDVTSAVRTTAKTDPEGLTLRLEPKGSRLAAQLGGHLPAGARVRRTQRVDDPRLLAGYALRAILKDVGIQVTGDVRLGGEQSKRLLASHRSAPLAELLSSLGKDSDNFYAEMIFKAIAGAEKKRPATSAAAAEIAATYLSEVGAFDQGTVVKNGSGLFDSNRATPSGMSTLLRAAYRDPAIAPEFVAQLAIGGVDGTLRSRLRAWRGRRAVRAKTGTLDAVSALSGYVLAPPERSPAAFVIFVNRVPGRGSSVRPAIDKVVAAIATELWKGYP